MAGDQDPELIRSLREPGRYPHPVAQVELIETHVSWVLLTGRFAYKIKKALDLGFLDFSRLAARRHFCAEEVRLNRRLAPALYLGVVPIGGTPAAPVLGGGGEPIEYAVHMVQFDPAAGFDRLIGRGALTPSHIDDLAAVAAAFHQGAARAGPDDPWGTPETIIGPARDNFAAIGAALPPGPAHEAMRIVEAWTEAQWPALLPLCAERRAAGLVRECHGDLHLANITLHEGRATPFDCLEFDPALRWIDLINEVAFLAMDLDHHGEPGLSHRFLNAWLHHTGDYQGVTLLPFYQTYRAMVRAKIEAIRLGQQTPEERDPQRLTEYLRLAAAGAKPRRGAIVITHGFSGSGKTTLTEPLLEPLRLIRIRSDVERKRLAGLHPDARSRSELDAGLYGEAASERTYRHLLETAATLVEAGRRVLVDATFLRAPDRTAFRRLAARANVPFVILHLDAPDAVLRARIRARGDTDASEATEAVLEHQLRSTLPLAPEEASMTLSVDTTDPARVSELAARLGDRLGKAQEP